MAGANPKNLGSLPPLGGDIDTLTLSGFSSGSFISHQLHIVYSEMVKGVGLHEGGPYFSWTDHNKRVAFSEKFAKNGGIDPLSNLQDAPVYITSGSNDHICTKEKQENQKRFYEHYGANVNFVKTEFNHLIPVDKEVSENWPLRSCNNAPIASLVNCKFDLAGNILRFIYENLDKHFRLKDKIDDWKSLGVLRKYDQHEFVPSHIVEDGFSDFGGYVYYPHFCVQDGNKCKIHVFFHGCTNSAERRGQDMIRDAGFL